MMDLDEMEEIEPGQDYEVVVDFRPDSPLDLENFYNDLSEMGTSIQLGEGDGMYRLHIHVPTDNRYTPIDYTMKLGTITKVSMENLMAQMEDIEQAKNEQDKPGRRRARADCRGRGFSRPGHLAHFCQPGRRRDRRRRANHEPQHRRNPAGHRKPAHR